MWWLLRMALLAAAAVIAIICAGNALFCGESYPPVPMKNELVWSRRSVPDLP